MYWKTGLHAWRISLKAQILRLEKFNKNQSFEAEKIVLKIHVLGLSMRLQKNSENLNFEVRKKSKT